MSYNLTVHISNFNGMRNQIASRGRMQITIDSLLETVPRITGEDVILFDNFSEDGSWEYLTSLGFGRLIREKRIITHPNWLSTTINNLRGIAKTIQESDSQYIWNIENDSFFYGNGSFLPTAIRVLDENSDISAVHLKRWTDFDMKDSPGVPINMNRYDEVRKTSKGENIFILEKRPEYTLWIPIDRKFIHSLDEKAGMGLCPKGKEVIGAIREVQGKHQRLLTEYWNGYTNHGWIARRKDLKYLLDKYKPLGERQLAIAFKKHFKSAKLSTDGFIDFGWKFRHSPSEDDILKLFEQVSLSNSCSIKEYGNRCPVFEAGSLKLDETQIDVYN